MSYFELSLDSETFNDFKSDFKSLLNNTINTMQQKDVETASITAKFEITLLTVPNPNLDAPDSSGEREITIPSFKHKVTAAMQLKSEKAGYVGGDGYELQWNRLAGAFVLVPIKDSQTSMFDRGGYDYDEAENDE